MDGFLPQNDSDEKPTAGQSGFREFGLPFASDPAITRHLAAFLNSHLGPDSGNSSRPDVVLFNGGFFASPVLRKRLLSVVSSWYAAGTDWQPLVLDNDRLDLAVARGAAYYGMVRRGKGFASPPTWHVVTTSASPRQRTKAPPSASFLAARNLAKRSIWPIACST